VTLTTDKMIILASGNPGKLEELRALLGPSTTVESAPDLGIVLPEETGTTFEENAILKARAVAKVTGAIAIADDSGLEVDALDGAPGVYSARYAGVDADDDRNIAKLLQALEDVADERRTARFRSVIAIAFSADQIVTTSGSCEGRIIRERRGDGGFGYDPVFLLPGGRTMAELGPDEKNAISHRGHAMRAAIEVLRQHLLKTRPEAG
jgi:XTP/dITP diphosphohydrolase